MKSKRVANSALIAVAILLTSLIAQPGAYSYDSKATLPSWANDATIYEVNLRQYTKSGSFKEFETHLTRLQKLGVKILWLMPIQPISHVKRKGTLGSPYSIADYKGINPEFGNIAEFKELVTQAHQMGFKVVLDWVANHSGWDNKWISNKDWYHQDSDGNIISPNPDWSDVAWLNYENLDMRAAMIDAMAYWVKEFDIDGFRADVASGVPNDFWKEASLKLQSVKPLFMLAEAQSIYGLLDDAFIADYNWDLKDEFRFMSSGQYTQSDFLEFASDQLPQYPNKTLPMNFITNHDENSWNGNEFKRYGKATNSLGAFTFVYPGIPLIYSGQEVGSQKDLAFFEKDLISNLNRFNEFTALYSRLVQLKKINKALWNNAPLKITAIPSNNPQVLSFARINGDNKVIYLFNATNKKIKIKANLKVINKKSITYRQFSNNKNIKLNQTLEQALAPWSFEIYSTSLSL
jgi:glycosidase